MLIPFQLVLNLNLKYNKFTELLHKIASDTNCEYYFYFSKNLILYKIFYSEDSYVLWHSRLESST